MMSSGITLLIYVIVCYGVANTVIFARGPFHVFEKMHSYFTEHHPMLEELSSCFICSGWWYGLVFSAINMTFFPGTPVTPMAIIGIPSELWYVTLFCDGAFTSGALWLTHTCQGALEALHNE